MVPGTQVGAYRLLQQIGEGGMGTVWLAEHTMLGRRAAIKLLHPMFTVRQDIVTRFFNEARAATAIADPGIVQIFDFGQHVDGTAYIAMEMLEGEPLDKRLSRLGRFGVNDAMRIMRQVASTLGVAHARGIVHRDLKPENIYLVRDPEVAGGERAKVLDFGIAKLTGDVQSKTNTSAVMGTPAYMSPEQCRGAGRVDQRADVYSLGCVLYALCTGAPPFDTDEGAGEIIAMHLREQPKPPSTRAAGIPRELDALILRCLAKDPAQRFTSGTELAGAIGGLLGTVQGHPSMVTGPRQTYPTNPSAQAATTLSASSGMALPVARSGSRKVVLGTVGLVVVGGIVAIAATRGGDAGPNAPIAAAGTSPSSSPSSPSSPSGSPAVAPVASPSAPSPSAAVATPPAPEAKPPAPPPPPDPSLELAGRMKTVLARFVAWSHDHAGAACPSASELGAPVQDPWGHPFEITCTDQPARQIIGAISAGPDGVTGNADDVASWQLGHDVTSLVAGARWVTAPPPAAAPPPALVTIRPPPVAAKSPPPVATKASPPADRPKRPVTKTKPDDDDIPTTR
jgi:serine/threonine protein kinase